MCLFTFAMRHCAMQRTGIGSLLRINGLFFGDQHYKRGLKHNRQVIELQNDFKPVYLRSIYPLPNDSEY